MWLLESITTHNAFCLLSHTHIRRWLWKPHSCWTTRYQTTGSSRQGPTWWRQRLGGPVVGAGWRRTRPCHGRPAGRNEWDARPRPAARAARFCRNPPSGWGMWRALPAVRRALSALQPSSRLNIECRQTPLTIFWCCGQGLCSGTCVARSRQSWDTGLIQEKRHSSLMWMISVKDFPDFEFKNCPFFSVMKNSNHSLPCISVGTGNLQLFGKIYVNSLFQSNHN